MKTKINQLIKFGILTLGISFFLFTACETENEKIESETTHKYYAEKVTFPFYQTNVSLIKKVNDLNTVVKSISNVQNRSSEQKQAYIINVNQAIYIENTDGTHHTYTFEVIEQDSLQLLNVVLSLKPEGDYKAYLTTYELTEQERIDINNGVFIDLTERTSIVEIDNSQVNYANRAGGSCWNLERVGQEDCSCHETHAAGGCTHPQDIHEWVEVPCPGGGGGSIGGGGTGDGNGMPTSGGGAGSGGNTVPTAPAGIQNNEDPCNPAPEGDINGNCMLEYFEACFVDTNILRNFNNQELDGIASFIDNAGCNETSQSIVQFVANENCEVNIVMDSWSNNLSENEEPKWGQLANKQEIIDEVNNISGLNDLPYSEQITALANHFEKNLMYTRNNEGELEIINPLTDVNRYIYSEVGGWIDFHHVFKIFEWATQNGPFSAITGGEMGELIQSVKDNESAYSYEDLPSNLLGVAMYVRFSQDLAQGNITWAEAVETTLNEISCIEPELAPNFDYIPHIVNGYYPQNFTYSPLLGEQLRAYHKAKFCERPIDQQINIKEAHEKFPR